MPSIAFDDVMLCYAAKGHHQSTFKDLILHALLRRPMNARPPIKALDGVSFRVEPGECVGIIGRNGAGKSTLLRAIAGVYPLESGERVVDGHVNALFDIAAGFEWNATGWENIRLRGYLQGETPVTIHDKLAAIAEFTELGDFLDKPLKSYSTGKIMLLSFAIATCCNPDILLIDEFLSTGDVHVRAKAIFKMTEMLRDGRIVVAASHDLAFLGEFCTRVLWLDRGKLVEDGPAAFVIDRYLRQFNRSPCAAGSTG